MSRRVMGHRIAYLGDSALPGPASYLAGIMTHFRLPFIYVPSNEPPPDEIFDEAVGLYVLSDYPAARFSAGAMDRLCRRVAEGAKNYALCATRYGGPGAAHNSEATANWAILSCDLRADGLRV